jgi:histidinol-phosphate/aromatic aminotransferase/cobyric acid decarboxylase-like protein/choline kinase
MKAIVLAAGLGARMRPITDTLHKSLVSVGGTTILGRIVDGLLGIDVRDILVVTGYLAPQVRGWLHEHYPDIAFDFVHNARYAETNNIVSLAMALEHLKLDDDVILVECDVLFDPTVLRRLTSPERGNIALVDRYRPGMDGTVVAVADGMITQVFPPHLQGEDFDYRDKYKTLNVYRFDGEFCRTRFQPLLSCYANVIDSGVYYELVLGMLINMQRERVRAEVVDGDRWTEVDDPNDLAVARFVFEPARRLEILERAFGGHWNFDVLDFTFMRNMYYPTDAMIAAMRRALPALARNYGSTQRVLNGKLALALRSDSARVQCLHGAAQVFPLLPELLGARTVLLPEPTFGEFPRWFPRHETYADAVGVDREALAARAGAFDLVVIVNPNNPTGTTLPTAWLHALAARHPRTTFLVDESFIDFSGEASLRARLDREPLPNVLVIASLSKSLGVPGLRLGYAYTCDARLHEAIGARVPIWNLGAPAEFFLELLLKFQPELAASLERTAADREDFAERLARVPGVTAVHAGGGNFLLARLAGTDTARVRRLVERLLTRESIYVKDVSAKLRAPSLRLAVRKPVENQRLVDALGAHLGDPAL